MSTPDAPPADGELRMSLFDHLKELRSRLFRVVIAVVILGGAALAFARPLFGLLMRPVLEALPPEARSLIYTSGIEEINVLMKVGLYAGIFLATPVLLWQLWGFVAPGLYPSERRYASPFVVLGTLSFILGASFCYFLVLPSMFQFLLNQEDTASLKVTLDDARRREEEALRALRYGDPARAATLATAAEDALSAGLGTSLVPADLANPPSPRLEAATRFEALGRLMDAVHQGFGGRATEALAGAMDLRQEALASLEKDDYATAGKQMEEAAALLAGVTPKGGPGFTEVWALERELARGDARHAALAWTRPMLTMKEQLGLVLLLLLAFGVIFELPLVMALLSLLGVLKASVLFRYQRHAFVVCLILTALLTPTGDAVNLALMCGPMFLCYELGVLAAWIIEKRRAKQAALAPNA